MLLVQSGGSFKAAIRSLVNRSMQQGIIVFTARKYRNKRLIITSLVVRTQVRGKKAFHNRHVFRIPG